MKTNGPKSNAPTPDFEPIPGSVPKQSPKPAEPLAAQSPPMSPNEESPNRSGSGEDPLVESGLPDNDPERPQQTDEERSM